MDSRRRLHRLLDDLLGDDPRAALIALRCLRERELPWLEQRAVHIARRDGWPLARMARLLGVTRQSLHAKHRVPPPVLSTIPRDDWPAQHSYDAEGCRLLDRMLHPNDGIPW